MIANALRNIEILKLVSAFTWQEIALFCGERTLLLDGKFDFDHFQSKLSSPEIGEKFHDALEVINELGTDDGRNILLTAADVVQADIGSLAEVPSHELAARIWLQSHENSKLKDVLTFARYTGQDAKRDRRYREFVGESSGIRCDRPTTSQIEAELQEQLKKLKQSEACRIYTSEDDTGEWHYDIIRGDAAKRVLAIQENNPTVLEYLAGAGDHIRYDPLTNRLGISTRSPRLLAAYRAVWGNLIAHNSSYFDGENICTLQPLQKKGSKLFGEHTVRSIVAVTVTELHWRNSKNEKVSVRAADCFRIIEDFDAVKRDGDFVEAKLKITFLGQRRPGKVTIKTPNILDINAGAMEMDVERLLNKLGIRGPFGEDGKKQDFWSISASDLHGTDWRRRIGDDFDRLVREGILRATTLATVTHPAHPLNREALAVKVDENQEYFGVSEDDDAIYPRKLTSSDVMGYRLDLSAMANKLARELGLAGVCCELGNGIWSLGYRDFTGVKINLFLAAQRLTSVAEQRIISALGNGQRTIIVPDDAACSAILPAVACRLPHGPFRLWEDIVLKLGLHNEICPSKWANADLIVNTDQKRIWYKGVELTKILPGSQPYKFAAKLVEAKGKIITKNDLGKHISGARSDDKVAAIAKDDFKKKLHESFVDIGQEPPASFKDIFIAGGGGYRLNCKGLLVP